MDDCVGVERFLSAAVPTTAATETCQRQTATVVVGFFFLPGVDWCVLGCWDANDAAAGYLCACVHACAPPCSRSRQKDHKDLLLIAMWTPVPSRDALGQHRLCCAEGQRQPAPPRPFWGPAPL
ncbi:hypothetical protein BU14_3081s0001, partial [Porphyra umbilicalis]